MDKKSLIEELEATLVAEDQEKLKELAKEAIAAHPQEAFGYKYLGEAMLLELPIAWPEAEVCLAKAIELEPKNVDHMARFAEVKDFQTQFDDAQIIWTKVLDADPNHFKALLAMGSYQLREAQDYAAAEVFLSKAVQIDGDHADARLCRAAAYNGLGQHEDAIADINHLMVNGFSEQGALIKLTSLKQIGNVEEWNKLYQELIYFLPENFNYPFNYGQVLLSKGEYEDAVKFLEEAVIRLGEANAEAMFYRLLGEAAIGAGQANKAIYALEKAVKMDSKDNETFCLLVQAKIDNHEYPGALQDLEVLWHRSGDNVSLKERLIILKGMALMGQGDNAAAEAAFTPLAQTQCLRQKDAFYGLGLLYHRGGNDEAGYKFMRMAAKLKHPKAQPYIQDNFTTHLQETKNQILNENTAAFAQNDASVFLQKLFGKLWKFADLQHELISDMSEEEATDFKTTLADFSMLFTEKGVVILTEQGEEIVTYSLKKEAAKGVLVDFKPLDKFPAFTVKLGMPKENVLTFSRQKGNILLLKEQDLSNIPSQIADNYKKYITKEEVAFLGDKAAPVLGKLL